MKYKIFLFASLYLLGMSTTISAQLASNTLETYLKSNQIHAQSAGNGIYYEIKKEGRGGFPKAGDYVQVSYVGKLLDGKIFDRSKEEPIVFQLGQRQVIPGWELGIPLFRKGATGILYLPAELAYGHRGAGKAVPPNAPLIFEIELADIMDINAYDRYMDGLEEIERQRFERQQAEQFQKDKALIADYIKAHKLKAKQTPSGLSYVINKKGKGKKTAQAGDEIVVAYEGFLINDQSFDASGMTEPYRFTLGKGKVIKGWDEGLQYFKRGGEGWLLIPSKLAYGARPIEEEGIHVPANAVLIFKVKVVQLKSQS